MPKDKPEIRFAGYTDAWEKRKLGEIGETHSGIGFPENVGLVDVEGRRLLPDFGAGVGNVGVQQESIATPLVTDLLHFGAKHDLRQWVVGVNQIPRNLNPIGLGAMLRRVFWWFVAFHKKLFQQFFHFYRSYLFGEEFPRLRFISVRMNTFFRMLLLFLICLSGLLSYMVLYLI